MVCRIYNDCYVHLSLGVPLLLMLEALVAISAMLEVMASRCVGVIYFCCNIASRRPDDTAVPRNAISLFQ